MAKRILIVDDDPDLREATRVILTAAGYEVGEAPGAAEGWEQLQGGGIDLMILDVMMETDTEGFHLAYNIRQDEKLKDLPIIMLTGIEGRMGEKIEPKESGDYLPVEVFLRKPVGADELKAKVAELLG